MNWNQPLKFNENNECYNLIFYYLFIYFNKNNKKNDDEKCMKWKKK